MKTQNWTIKIDRNNFDLGEGIDSFDLIDATHCQYIIVHGLLNTWYGLQSGLNETGDIDSQMEFENAMAQIAGDLSGFGIYL